MRSDPSDVALRNLRRLVERDPILRDIVNPSLPAARRAARLVPPVDVIEHDDRWTLVLEVPGVAREAIKVHLDGSRLTITGTKARGWEDGGRSRVSERETGSFTREFLVPFQVRPDAIRAHLADGVLTVVLPRSGTDRILDIAVE
jgi:HSP20 family protein